VERLLVGKGRHIRTVPVPDWVATLDEWTRAAAIADGRLFRCVNRSGSIWGDGITEKVVWHIVKYSAKRAGIQQLAPHDCRRTCARLCHAAGGELEQIQFLLGYVSVETTERYLGCQQRLRQAVNDKIGLEPDTAPLAASPAQGKRFPLMVNWPSHLHVFPPRPDILPR